MKMKTMIITMCIGTWFACAATGQDSHAHSSDPQTMHTHHPTGDANGTEATITGYVRDIACLVRNPKAGAATTPLTQDCMEKCIRGGSPIAILSEEGSLYMPISDVIPDINIRSQLTPYVGKYIKATGRVFERGGLHAISIEKIEVTGRPHDSKIPTL